MFSSVDASPRAVFCPALQMVTVKTPPVMGTRATSPRSVPKVERSSCANYQF
jgi:hypothetical protein